MTSSLFRVLLCLLISSTAADAVYVTFLDNGPPANRVDIVFLGDGYTSIQLGT